MEDGKTLAHFVYISSSFYVYFVHFAQIQLTGTLMRPEILEMSHFGETLRRLIRDKNLDQTSLAKAAGLSRGAVTNAIKSDVFKGESATYRALAQALEMSTKELDAAWKGDADVEASRAKHHDEEKVMDIVTVFAALERLNPTQCKMLRGAIEERLKAFEDEQNSRATRSARTGSRAS